MYYECHITINKDHLDKANSLAKQFGFKTSAIDGDSVLGDIVLGYITFRRSTYEDTFEVMDKICNSLGFPVLRRKIEHIVYDWYPKKEVPPIGMGAHG